MAHKVVGFVTTLLPVNNPHAEYFLRRFLRLPLRQPAVALSERLSIFEEDGQEEQEEQEGKSLIVNGYYWEMALRERCLDEVSIEPLFSSSLPPFRSPEAVGVEKEVSSSRIPRQKPASIENLSAFMPPTVGDFGCLNWWGSNKQYTGSFPVIETTYSDPKETYFVLESCWPDSMVLKQNMSLLTSRLLEEGKGDLSAA